MVQQKRRPIAAKGENKIEGGVHYARGALRTKEKSGTASKMRGGIAKRRL